jgi:hypothetical protein
MKKLLNVIDDKLFAASFCKENGKENEKKKIKLL